MVALKVSKNSTLRTARRWGFRLILHFWGMGKFNHDRDDRRGRGGPLVHILEHTDSFLASP